MTKQQHLKAAVKLLPGDPVRRWHLDAVAGIEVAETLGVSSSQAKPIARELRPTLRAWHEAWIDNGDPEKATEQQFELLETLREYGFDRDPAGIVDGYGLWSWLEREYGQLIVDPDVRRVAALLELVTNDEAASSYVCGSDGRKVEAEERI